MKKLLSWLLHHANRGDHYSYKGYFYPIKNKILSKYGKYKGIDVQFIEGKKCYRCNGTGVYVGYYEMSGQKWTDTCHSCSRGWYKLPRYVILKKIQLGKYLFHQPSYSYESSKKILAAKNVNYIQGYIEHDESKYSEICSKILFFIYDYKIFKLRYVCSLGVGWCTYWWLPKNWINNIVWYVKHKLRKKDKLEELPF